MALTLNRSDLACLKYHGHKVSGMNQMPLGLSQGIVYLHATAKLKYHGQ